MKLLLLDEFGIQPFESVARTNLLAMIEDRHGKKSTIIASQIPVGAWHDAIANKTVADAIMDRIVHDAIRIGLKVQVPKQSAIKE